MTEAAEPAIGQCDAALAIKLWALATHRYVPARQALREDPPEPVELYAGLEHLADPVALLRSLAGAITDLAEDWEGWDDHIDLDRPLTEKQKAVIYELARRSRTTACPRRAL